jgi:hypothetical protein
MRAVAPSVIHVVVKVAPYQTFALPHNPSAAQFGAGNWVIENQVVERSLRAWDEEICLFNRLLDA